jgi:hypothetical protein
MGISVLAGRAEQGEHQRVGPEESPAPNRGTASRLDSQIMGRYVTDRFDFELVLGLLDLEVKHEGALEVTSVSRELEPGVLLVTFSPTRRVMRL